MLYKCIYYTSTLTLTRARNGIRYSKIKVRSTRRLAKKKKKFNQHERTNKKPLTTETKYLYIC